MVSPVTEENSTKVEFYLPDDIFYDFETHRPLRGHGELHTVLDVPFDRIPLHIRGGCIIPLRAESANTTSELRLKDFEILVALGLDGTAAGQLYVDDGESLDGGKKVHLAFSYTGGKFTSTILDGGDSADAGVRIRSVKVIGQDLLHSHDEL